MLAELLVLSTLQEQDSTIYGLRKTINARFCLFCSASLSVIHRALKKLSAEGHVKVKKSMSKGGQRSSKYSITQSGREYLGELMTTDLPANPVLAGQLANIRVLLLGTLEKPIRSRATKVLKDYFRGTLVDFENFADSEASKGLNRNYMKQEASAINEKLKFLNFQELS
jgi:DNA-binding PadR family transcriptional regulator